MLTRILWREMIPTIRISGETKTMKVAGWVCIAACLLGMSSSKQGSAESTVQACPESVSPNGDVIPPLLTKRVNPRYPTTLRLDFASGGATVEGDVVMNIVIGVDGSVRDIKVTHGLPQLIPTAMHAASQWQYEPARVNGVAIACKTSINMVFRQTDDTAAEAAMKAGNDYAPGAGGSGAKPILPPPPQGILRVSSRAMENLLVKRVDPTYPTDSVAVGARGAVVLLATVDKTGSVSDLQVLSGPQRFRDAATDAVKQWIFRPYLVDENPVSVQTAITLDFAPPSK